MLAAFRARVSSDARRRIAGPAEERPDLDSLWRLYEGRSAALERAPPAADWDGSMDADRNITLRLDPMAPSG